MTTYLRIKVLPKSPKTELTDTLADGTLKIRVAAPPEKGKANVELIKFLARRFNVAKENVSIVSGKSDSLKLVKITKTAQNTDKS